MALTPSNMLPLGIQAPDFCLPDGKGEFFELNKLSQTNGLLVMFISNHCPFVIHLAEELALLSEKIGEFKVGMVAINSNDVQAYPADSPTNMVKESAQRGYQFPYLFDESQAVAKAYDAACTPDFYLFNGQQKLVYRGQFDDSRPGNSVAVSGKDIYQALAALKNGQPINPDQRPSVGCNIKWKG
jgi:peroxiredoxin